jgi:hypothetical protein
VTAYDQMEERRRLLAASHATAKRCADELARATAAARTAADDLEAQLERLCREMRDKERREELQPKPTDQQLRAVFERLPAPSTVDVVTIQRVAADALRAMDDGCKGEK